MKRKNSAIMMDYAQYLAARSLLGFMHCFDVETNLDTAARVGSIACRANRSRRERALANVRSCFPEATRREAEWIVERSYQHMLQLFLVDAVAAPKLITEDAWPKYVKIGELQSVLDLLIRRKPMIFITGHCGNWELLALLLAVIGYPLHALARPLDNPYLNRWLLDMREARGTRIITKWGAMPVVRDVLQSGGRVAFIADQNAGDSGLFVPFFGRLASSYKSIALLAIHHNVPIVAGHAQRIGNHFRYELHVTDVIHPDDWVDQDDPVFYVTARYNRAIEQMVRAAPGQYLWVHRRWKSRPRHERLGRAFPVKLACKLESLPWMTPAELDRIVRSAD